MITATEAKIHTFSVTVQSLTVKDKQMTLAVFRQLPQGGFYENINIPVPGTPWGLVSYNIKDQGDLWVVQEVDGILYRCAFPSKIPVWSSEDIVEEIKGKLNEALLKSNSEYFKGRVVELQKELVKAQAVLDSRVRFNSCMEMLISGVENLPQLFIAV